jgi:hypothetical protein
MDSYLAGRRRAQARQVPKGYEQSSAWTTKSPSFGDQTAWTQLYEQREADRIAAQNANIDQRMQQTGIWEPYTQRAPGASLSGLVEGMYHNDAISGIDSATGEVTGPQKRALFQFPTESAYDQGTQRLARGGMGGNRAYALMALRQQLEGK